jgi:protein-tyrosine-phosphatase
MLQRILQRIDEEGVVTATERAKQIISEEFARFDRIVRQHRAKRKTHNLTNVK